MSAEVSFVQFRAMKGSSERDKSTALITRDLLGGCCSTTNIGSRELELDSHVPFGWEKRLDLKSGNVYLQRCNSPTTSSDHNDPFYGTMSKQSLDQFAEMSLDLKLVSSSSSPSSSSANYQSVCTLDKVKSALERAEKEKTKKRSPDCSYSYSSHLIKENQTDCDEKSSPLTFATGCPNCLLYVLVSVKTPKCPRCNTIIPSHFAMKKPRIDLNMSI